MNTPGLSIDSAYQYLGNANMRTITDGVFKGWPVNQELGSIGPLGPFPGNVGKRDGWMEEEKHQRRRDTRTSLLSNVELSLEGLEAGRRKNGD